MKYRSLIIFSLLLLPTLSLSQVKEFGIPFINNFSRTEYQAATQNWALLQDSKGFIYAANNSGILEYDGSNWRLIPMKNGLVVRAIKSNNKGKIYVGSFNEFGFLGSDNSGKLVYKSLIDQIDEKYRDFGDVWRIHITDSKVYFQSFKYLFILNENGKFDILESNQQFDFSFQIDNKIFIQDRDRGLFEIDESKFKLLNHAFFKNNTLWLYARLNEKMFIAGTQNNGLYVFKNNQFTAWECEANEFLKENQLYSFAKLGENNLVFGSIQNGIIITNKNGDILQHINKQRGLQNNTVLSITADYNDNLWLGLDNGISYIETNSPFSYLNEGLGLQGTGYDAMVWKNKIYLGTNQGLYYSDWNKRNNKKFQLVQNSNGQVWNLQVVNDKLYCGHHNGLYEVVDNKLKLVHQTVGSWLLMPNPNDSTIIFEGYYNGLIKHTTNTKGNISNAIKVDSFDESSRIMEWDKNGNLWMSHGYKGVYKIKFHEVHPDSIKSVKFYTNDSGLPSHLGNYVYKLNNELIFSTIDGIYQYNTNTDKFYKSDYYNNLFHHKKNIRTPVIDDLGNIWFIANEQAFILQPIGFNEYQLNSSIFLKVKDNFVQGFEKIILIDKENILIISENGFLHINPQFLYVPSVELNSYVRKFTLTRKQDSTIFWGSLRDSTGKFLNDSIPYHTEIQYKYRSFKIEYSSPYFQDNEATEYSFYLENFDEEWSEWSSNKVKEYTNLMPGNYTFHLRSKNVFNTVSEESLIEFSILPPWFLSKVAITIYALALLLGIYGVHIIIRKRFSKERSKLQQEQEIELRKKDEAFAKEAAIAERKIFELKEEKLQAEITRKRLDVMLKNRELASSALQLVHKNEMLNQIRNEINKVAEGVNEKSQKELKDLVKKINTELKLDQDWDNFKMHFDKVHGDFIKKLQNDYELLTPKDLKLCAYLKMNLSTKEIAPLLNISVRGVEISRYRLRKKLNLNSETNLVEFLMTIDSSN